MRNTVLTIIGLVAAVAAVSAVVGCSGGESASDDLKLEAMETYADGVHASYVASLESAEAMDIASRHS